MDSLLQRLKERKLVQWALAYLAGTFVVFQLLDALADPLGLTLTTQRAILVVVGIGFFVTLVLAWYHGERGQQRVSGPELCIIALLLVTAGTGIWVVAGREAGVAPTETAVPIAVEDDRPAIAVLPFDNFSPDPGDTYFADGMQEQLVLTLSKISGLSVRGRTSAMQYREEPKPVPEIADELGVTYIVEGSARIAGGNVVVTAQLIDAVRDEHLWADEYDRDFSVDEIVSIHRDIAEHVASELRTLLTSADEARLASEPTDDPEAFNLFLLGRSWWAKRNAGALWKAVEYFEGAIERDSTFALAHAGLANTYAVLPFYFSGETGGPDAVFPQGERAALRALALSPDLPDAHAALGAIRLYYENDVPTAEEQLRRATALDPSHATAHHWLADLHAYQGRFDEAIAAEQAALTLDPLSLVSNVNLGVISRLAGEYEAAVRQYERALEISPQAPHAWLGLTYSLLQMDSIRRAESTIRTWAELYALNTTDFTRIPGMVEEYRRSGNVGALPPSLDTIRVLMPEDRARFAALVGDVEGALEWLEESVSGRWPGRLEVPVDPIFDPLRGHPRFQALMTR